METLREYASTWLTTVSPTLRENTVRAYEQHVRVRIVPVLGDIPLDTLARRQLKEWFVGLLARYKPSTAANALLALHTMLNAAVEDDVISVNPASALRRALRGVLRGKEEASRPPMTQDQLQAFLAAAREDEETYPGMMLLALTGLRVGEAVGLQWDDVDFEKKAIRVRRQVYPKGNIGALKSGAGLRTVDMADRLANVLWALRTRREMDEHTYRVPSRPWVLFPDLGRGFSSEQGRKRLGLAVKAACIRAGIPAHFSCHSLRHTIATHLFEQGAHPKYVQRLLGHSSMAITSDRYAKTAHMTDQGVIERYARGATTNGLLTGAKENA